MNFQRLTGEIKRLEALIANARAKARAASLNEAGDALVGTVGPMDTVSFTSAHSITVGPSGTVYLVATCNVAAGAGSSVAGELMHFQLLLDGSPISGDDTFQELSVTHANASAAVVGKASGLTPGSSHTFGIEVTNATNTGHSLIMTGSTQLNANSP